MLRRTFTSSLVAIIGGHSVYAQSLRESKLLEPFAEIPWVVAERHTDAYPYLVRFRQFSEDFPRSTYPKRLNIFWSVQEADDIGLATKQELARLHVFEDRLVEAVEHDKSSVLAAVVTGRGEREFVFFVRNPQEFIGRLSAMPQEAERYPIEIHLNEDPDWLYFHDLAANKA